MSDMAKSTETRGGNPLATEPVGRLIAQFAIPTIIALVVNSLYNIVDQIFIGNFVGELGNAATNIAFPLSTLCMALTFLFGVGGSAAFNLSMGRGEKEKAPYYLGNSVTMLVLCGIVLMAVTLIFLTPLLRLFGSPDEVLPYAQSYVRITAIGFPFHLLGGGAGHLVRADGRPRASMGIIISGALVNVGLDALFVAGLGWGMQGAAAATVIGQVLTAVLGIWFLSHIRTVNFSWKYLVPHWSCVGETARLGMAPCLNQLASMVVQIAMNNTLRFYGGMSIYGESVPIAVVGIITKVSMITMSTLGGLSQGVQPIASFNYGAKQYDRVRKAFRLSLIVGFLISVATFLIYQIFPRQIISLFGGGSSEAYYQFAIAYFRIYLMLTFINYLPQMASTLFTAIGKPMRGTWLSLSRQIVFFLPLLIIFPFIWGIDGVMYVGPVADALAIVVSVFMLVRVFRELRRLEK